MTTYDIVEKVQAYNQMFDEPLSGIKEVSNNFLLLTYDIPNTAEGAKIRGNFLHSARRLGFVQYTESVYFNPNPQGDSVLSLMSLSRESGVKAIVWHGRLFDKLQEQMLMSLYDITLSKWLDEIDERNRITSNHLLKDHVGLAKRMIKLTLQTVSDLDFIVQSRASPILNQQLLGIKKILAELVYKAADMEKQV